MSLAMEHSSGPPRFDRNERLRHRFYEPLTLLWMLNPSTGPSVIQPPYPQRQLSFTVQWQRFLDNLSHFGDYMHGGITVCAIACEERDPEKHFLICARTKKMVTHLEWILKSLSKVQSMDDAERRTLSLEIAQASIRLSFDKVKYYCCELQKAIWSDRKHVLAGFPDQMVDMIERIYDTIIDAKMDRVRCCDSARLIPEQDLNDLVKISSSTTSNSAWLSVRHNVKRLCTWHNKAEQLVAFANSYPDMFDNTTCEHIPLPVSVKMPKPDKMSNLRSALGRMLPKEEQDRAQRLYDDMNNLRQPDYVTQFKSNYGNQNLALTVHAEAYLMEYIYLNRLRMVEDCRYIGCSKPSCYCCCLYMRYHPGNFIVRAGHGQAWVTWSMPLLSQLDDELIRKHNLTVMNAVIGHLRREVLRALEDRFARRERLPDSTSGGLTEEL